MRERAAKVKGARSVFALVTIAAWFCLSNHCALGLALPAPDASTTAETGGCPMHSAPEKKQPVSKTPCCKDVRAVVAKCVTKARPFVLRIVGPTDYAAEIFGLPPRVVLEICGLDTGPPGCFSFAELVLQESMRAHAPPVS
ncbi:MAG: hypothetical protein QOE26_279 [Verrucomicrobiota bacterium]|jgi:hypothetical protein